MTRAPTSEALGAAIRERRKQLGLTQRQLAERVGTHRGYLSSIEAGRENPSWRLVGAIAEGLDVTVADLAARAQRHS